jgi:sigma-54 dependent transcriptional regulator, acetoin dehydrogenase operon transcriptional activator AcoR
MVGAKILVVEDEMILGTGIEVLLRRNGYGTCGPVASGEEALALGRTERPDLALMDVALEGELDGIATAARLRAQLGIPSIFLTAFADGSTVQRALAVAPSSYVLKPFNPEELLIAVEVALRRDTVEREARSRERWVRAALDGVADGVLTFDAEGRVKSLNDAAKVLSGVADEEAIGKPIDEVLRFDDGASCRVLADRGLSVTALRRLGLSLRTRGGGWLPVEGVCSPISGDRGVPSGYVCTFREIPGPLGSIDVGRAVAEGASVPGIVGRDGKLLEVFQTIRDVADSKLPVLIQGESGTGKELVASAIHLQGPRAGKRFVAVNCGALPDTLLESELFGYARGAFTGATKDKKGRFELADGGTLFLDEVGELSPSMQVKLLRVAQSGTFERLGSETTVKVDVRIISATNRDLSLDVAEGRFRKDLFYRLCVVPITVPPLRERGGDIPLLVDHVMARIAEERRCASMEIAPDALALLLRHSWPGNVRELEGTLQFAFVRSRGGRVEARHLPDSLVRQATETLLTPTKPPRLTAASVAEALRATGGNRVQAARRLDVARATLYRFLSDQQRSARDETPSVD